MIRKTTSIKIDPNLWKEVKKHCIDRDMDISDFIEALLKKNLPKDTK
ncbi:MAG: ribbon-helix-helix protein, CopG family [Nanoarchaeota archaeon]